MIPVEFVIMTLIRTNNAGTPIYKCSVNQNFYYLLQGKYESSYNFRQITSPQLIREYSKQLFSEERDDRYSRNKPES